MTERHAARVIVGVKTLLEFLQFEEGTLHRAYIQDEQWNPGELNLVIEHPDLPVARDGETLIRIYPEYTSTYDKHGHLIDLQRTDPPVDTR